MECLGTITKSGTRFTYYKDEKGGIWFDDEPIGGKPEWMQRADKERRRRHRRHSWEGGSIKIGNFKFSLPRFNLSWYANGGFPGMGEMFVARESGPELVGRMGNRSAVANNNQIIAGIRAGVFEAVVNAFESMQGRNDRGQELHIYLEGDAKKLFKVIRQEGNNYQKQTGNPVFG